MATHVVAAHPREFHGGHVGPQSAHQGRAEPVARVLSGNEVEPQRALVGAACVRLRHPSLASRGVQMARSPPWRRNATMSITGASVANS